MITFKTFFLTKNGMLQSKVEYIDTSNNWDLLHIRIGADMLL